MGVLLPQSRCRHSYGSTRLLWGGVDKDGKFNVNS